MRQNAPADADADLITLVKHPRGVLELRLNCGPGNILGHAAFDRLEDALRSADAEAETRVILFTSGQNQFFSNGLDPSLFIDRSADEISFAARRIIDSSATLLFSNKPVIAVINGHCIGAGAVLALYCDYRYMAARGARISFPEIHLGVTFPASAMRVLSDLVGARQARDLIYGGRALRADQAAAIGLIDQAFPAEDLFTRALEHATRLASASPVSVQGIRRAIAANHRRLLADLREFDIEELASSIRHPDTQRGFRDLRARTTAQAGGQ